MDNDKKINILIGISISAAAIYLLNAHNYIDFKFCSEKRNISTQCESKENHSSTQYSSHDITENEIKDKDDEIKDKDDEIKDKDDEIKDKDIDIIDKTEVDDHEIKKKLCLLNYIYNLSNFTKLTKS